MKLNNNIYVIDLSIDFGINFTFNIDCLMGYKSLINIISHVDEPSPVHTFESPFLSSLLDIYPIQHVKLINS